MTKPNNRQNAMVSITGLWLGTDRNDHKYMAGNCGGVRYWIFRNKHKEKDSDPDYLLKISQNLKPKPQQDSGPIKYGDGLEAPKKVDDIPF